MKMAFHVRRIIPPNNAPWREASRLLYQVEVAENDKHVCVLVEGVTLTEARLLAKGAILGVNAFIRNLEEGSASEMEGEGI
jgi:hypothetical protein